MGLDIAVHIGSKPCTDVEAKLVLAAESVHEEAENLGLCVPCKNEWHRRAEDLTEIAYRDERSYGFWAGSYSSYNRWREGLAQLAGIEMPPSLPCGIDPGMAAAMGIEPRPSLITWWNECQRLEESGSAPVDSFWQMIHFSDCNGALGPSVCKALAADFDSYAERAETHRDDGWRDLYAKFRMAFRHAAESGGWVEFT